MNATPHEATDACLADHCHSCQVDEPGYGYVLCGECGHLYRTARDLRRAYRREVLRRPSFGIPLWHRILLAATARADRITFCQECIHDF